jgi:hypothetical protein
VKIRSDLEGVVTAYTEDGHVVTLIAGQDVPNNVTVGEHVTERSTAEAADTDPLAALKLPELKAYATERSIDLAGASKKDDILAAIRAAEQDSAAATGDADTGADQN